MDFTRPTFWSAPFPSDQLRRNGRIDLKGFDTRQIALVGQVLQLNVFSDGFATSAGIFFPLTGALSTAQLPAIADTVKPGSPVFLVELEGPQPGRRYPLEVSYSEQCSPYGTEHLLTLLPLQGVPLHPDARYAAVVLRGLEDALHFPLGVSLPMAQLAAHELPDGASASDLDAYIQALGALKAQGVKAESIAGMTLFTTGNPTKQLGVFRDAVLAQPLPRPTTAFTRTDLFDDFCVYQSSIDMPQYQAGTPPYDTTGGSWATDANGQPELQRHETARIFLTIPRQPMPANGYPLAYLIGTGAGGDRALVDRGPQATTGGPPIQPGTGPALHFARAGFAGLTIDGPLEGPRNPTGADEDYLIFNLNNLVAMRDNLRQSALEVILTAHIVESGALAPDVSDCPGASGPVKFDTNHLALMGHSMGASILPLAAAWEPKYRAIILSGSGGSWIENIIYKQKPIDVKPFAEVLVNEPGGTMTAFDPAVSMVQWAAEAADSQVYGELLLRTPRAGEAPRQLLMEQGIVDHYILPRIANTTSLSVGLDLAGTPLDDNPEYVDQLRALDLLPLVGRGATGLPASGNVNGTTAVVIQHPSDGIEDGHEVVFQTDPPKHQYRCFLQSWLARGTPVVLPDGPADAPCQ